MVKKTANNKARKKTVKSKAIVDSTRPPQKGMDLPEIPAIPNVTVEPAKLVIAYRSRGELVQALRECLAVADRDQVLVSRAHLDGRLFRTAAAEGTASTFLGFTRGAAFVQECAGESDLGKKVGDVVPNVSLFRACVLNKIDDEGFIARDGLPVSSDDTLFAVAARAGNAESKS